MDVFCVSWIWPGHVLVACAALCSVFNLVLAATPEGYTKCDGSEWKFFPAEMKWLEAEEACVRDGAHLATLRTDRERQCFLQLANKAQYSNLVWVGVNDRKKEGRFVWAGDEELVEEVDSYRWLFGQPNGNRSGHPDQDCGYTAVGFKGKLGDETCNKEHGFLCEVEPESLECHGERWTFHSTMLNWQDANRSCHEHGGHLATINNQADRQCIRIAVQGGDTGLLWVGLTDLEQEGHFVWDSNNRSEPNNGEHWIPGQPNNADPQLQDCVYARNSDGRLGDDPCDTKLPFICELETETGEAEKEEEKEEEEEFPEWPIAVIALSVFLLILLVIFIRQRRRLSQERREEKDVEAQKRNFESAGYDDPRSEKDFTLKFTQGTPAKCTTSTSVATTTASQKPSTIHRQTKSKQPVYDQLRKLRCLPRSVTSLVKGQSNEEEAAFNAKFQDPGKTEREIYQQLSGLPYRHLARQNIALGKEIGCGKFGKVFKGAWKQPWSSNRDVAVKTLKESSTKDDRVAILREAAIMGQFRHGNVVQLHGVVAEGEPILLVLELMLRDLRSYLISMGDSGPAYKQRYLRMTRDIACGMAYLTSRGFVHRDLAARNIMINTSNVCKIGDFGMSRDLADEDYYYAHGGVVPVKWAALEAITLCQYSSASDVWSFGIVLYEIFTGGRKPYCFWSNQEAFEEVQNGYRLPQPEGCCDDMYRLMTSCWREDKHERPSFTEIVLILTRIN